MDSTIAPEPIRALLAVSISWRRLASKSEALHEARWWEVEPGGKVHRYLCPRHCHIGEGQGLCESRG
jgi:hypothetical protein